MCSVTLFLLRKRSLLRPYRSRDACTLDICSCLKVGLLSVTNGTVDYCLIPPLRSHISGRVYQTFNSSNAFVYCIVHLRSSVVRPAVYRTYPVRCSSPKRWALPSPVIDVYCSSIVPKYFVLFHSYRLTNIISNCLPDYVSNNLKYDGMKQTNGKQLIPPCIIINCRQRKKKLYNKDGRYSQ